jgi:hypothetical protein
MGQGKSLLHNRFLPPLGEGWPKDRKGAASNNLDFCKSLSCLKFLFFFANGAGEYIEDFNITVHGGIQ